MGIILKLAMQILAATQQNDHARFPWHDQLFTTYIYKFEDRSGTGLDKLAIKKIKDAH